MTARPNVSRDQVFAYFAAAGYTMKAELVMLGVRGGLDPVPGVNKVGVFDDLIAVITPTDCQVYVGNTDPSQELHGEANLKAGVWRFKPGFHHPGTPKQYAAFVQAAPVIVHRAGTDPMPIGRRDPNWGLSLGNGDWTDKEWFPGMSFNIHIHNAMGVNTTGSEGCQTIIMDQYAQFHDPALAVLQARGQASFDYVLYEIPKAA